MNPRFHLTVMTVPALAGSVLMAMVVGMSCVAVASEQVSVETTNQFSCDWPAKAMESPGQPAIEIRHKSLSSSSTGILIEDSTADFSAAESDAAVTLFGCDCPSCINALRQLRNQTLLSNSPGHCWTTLQQRVSPQEVREVLQTLEVEEARDLNLDEQ